jgi:hypothetical protein
MRPIKLIGLQVSYIDLPDRSTGEKYDHQIPLDRTLSNYQEILMNFELDKAPRGASLLHL